MDDRGLWWGGQETYIQHLAYEPGTSYQYSSSVDWAGFLIERITGKSLEEYFEENIFEPCGMTSTSFPSEERDYGEDDEAM